MRHKKGYQPIGWEGFVEACPTCMNQGSTLCFKCKMEVESGYEPMDAPTAANEKFTVYGGQRGFGRIAFLEGIIAFMREELEATKQDRDMWKSAALYYMEKANKKP